MEEDHYLDIYLDPVQGKSLSSNKDSKNNNNKKTRYNEISKDADEELRSPSIRPDAVTIK